MGVRPGGSALVQLVSGIGNIVLATPLLVALHRLGIVIDVLLDADYPQTADLLREWSLVRAVYSGTQTASIRFDQYTHLVPAVPPFYWQRYARRYAAWPRALHRPHDALFYANEQQYYLEFARRLGYADIPGPLYRLPIAPDRNHAVSRRTVVIAPGCKTGEMAAKRWPHFATLAEQFPDVVVVGTGDDLADGAGARATFPGHVRSLVDTLTLRECVELMAAAGVVVGNASGLCHAAAATGVPTVMLFGPTSELVLGQLPSNVTVLRAGLPCEPCWLQVRLGACNGRVDCLRQLSVQRVTDCIREVLGVDAGSASNGDPERDTPRVNATATTGGWPLVSCIMPTHNRRAFVPRAVSYFLRQDYPNRELIVLDDGTEPVRDLLPDDPRIRYEPLGRRLTLGGKRNLGCERARGDFIAHWDDDDWMADWRLSYQIQALLHSPTADVCGLDRLLFYEPTSERAWEYVYPSGHPRWVAGGTMCYRKAFWQHHRFPETNEGEDTRLLWSARHATIISLSDREFYIALVHPSNTSRKRIGGTRWHPYPVETVHALMRAPTTRSVATLP